MGADLAMSFDILPRDRKDVVLKYFCKFRSLKAKSKRPAQRASLWRAVVEALEDRELLSAWYVAATGAASNNGSLDQPFPTIQAAANIAQPGDTVFIMGGIYHETVIPHASGTSGAPITFQALAGQAVTIDG